MRGCTTSNSTEPDSQPIADADFVLEDALGRQILAKRSRRQVRPLQLAPPEVVVFARIDVDGLVATAMHREIGLSIAFDVECGDAAPVRRRVPSRSTFERCRPCHSTSRGRPTFTDNTFTAAPRLCSPLDAPARPFRYHRHVTSLVRAERPNDHDLDGLHARVTELEGLLVDAEPRSPVKADADAFRIKYRQQVGRLHEELDRLELALAEAELGILTERLGDVMPGAPTRRRSSRSRSPDSRRMRFASCFATSRRRSIPTSRQTMTRAIDGTR